jgi:hypothetical protein
MSSPSAVLTNPSVERVRPAFARPGLRAEIVELPGAARTAKAAADFLGCQLAQVANWLVFRAQATDSAVLVMSSFERFAVRYAELRRITEGTEADIST